MMEHLEDLEFSILVPLVLKDLLDGYGLTCLRNSRLEYHAEGAIADNFLSIISEALLYTNHKL